MNNLTNSLNYLDETKNLIKNAIVNKGQNITDSEPFRNYVNHIENIPLGVEEPGYWFTDTPTAGYNFYVSRFSSLHILYK